VLYCASLCFTVFYCVGERGDEEEEVSNRAGRG